MATDTARVQLELASGRNEPTAPFYQTAQRRRSKQLEPDPVSVDAPAAAQTIVAVPLAAPPAPVPVADPEISRGQRGGRTPWIAFAIAIASVGFAVWWVMAQRMPDIDPREIITRNLNDAHTAMADGRYTDPPERSAFHYYSTVLALDPSNTDAIEGIDAIADRHLTNARVLLAKHRIAEAGVALEKARRVRPDHNGLAVLDTQWRAELRKILAAATTIDKSVADAIEKPVIAQTRNTTRDTSKLATPAPEVKSTSAPLPKVSDVAAVTAALVATTRPATPPQTMVLPVAEAQPAAVSGTNVVEEQVAAAAPEPAPAVVAPAPTDEPKLIKMVQPQYPQEAMMRGIEGWVEVSLQVSAAGDVVAPRVEESSRGRMFNRAALAAVEQWKYEPPGDGSTGERIRVRLKFQQSK